MNVHVPGQDSTGVRFFLPLIIWKTSYLIVECLPYLRILGLHMVHFHYMWSRSFRFSWWLFNL